MKTNNRTINFFIPFSSIFEVQEISQISIQSIGVRLKRYFPFIAHGSGICVTDGVFDIGFVA